MEWKQLQSNIARCRSAMNAFLWALDKLNFPLGKEHVFWLKLLPPENFDKFVLQSKTKSSELQQFQGQQHFNMITADLLLMHPWWQVGFLLHFGFFFSLHGSSLLYSLHSSAHQAGKHGHDHLWLHFHKIFWKSINSGTNSSCHGHSIPIHHGKTRWSAPRLLPVNDKLNPAPSNTISPILY